MNRFTVMSDVWSFGVTLWEVFAQCRQRPYANMSDAQVIRNAEKCCDGDVDTHHLSTVADMPIEVHDLVRACTHTHATQRPTFNDIHTFLQKRCAGMSNK